MGELSRREQRLAIAFYLGTSVATTAWWALLLFRPDLRPAFLGHAFSERFLWILAGPDLTSALVMSTAMVFLLSRRHRATSILAWLHFGAQGYAWALSIGLAILDPAAYWGVVAMTFSAGIALAFALRIQQADILWGSFKFRQAPSGPASGHWRQALRQTAAMWIIFLAVIPIGIALIELAFGWNQHWLSVGWRIGVGVCLFVLGGSLGLWAGRTMTRYGDGTPLPSASARNLVVAGPYRLIRNPMALGGVVQGIAVGLIIGSPLVMLYAFIGAVWWDVLARPMEEQYLMETFGEAYRQFQRAVPCWSFRTRPWTPAEVARSVEA